MIQTNPQGEILTLDKTGRIVPRPPKAPSFDEITKMIEESGEDAKYNGMLANIVKQGGTIVKDKFKIEREGKKLVLNCQILIAKE